MKKKSWARCKVVDGQSLTTWGHNIKNFLSEPRGALAADAEGSYKQFIIKQYITDLVRRPTAAAVAGGYCR